VSVRELANRALLTYRLRRHGVHRHMSVFSHTTPSERLTLFHLARFLPRGARALEIGSHIGSSALFLCAGLRHCGGSLICVDTWMNQTMPEGERDTFSLFRENTRLYSDMITPIRKFSSELSSDDIEGELDLAFIDGDHSEEAVRRDFHFVAQRLKLGGWIVFHDVANDCPGVTIVIGEALASGSWQLFRHLDRMGIIKRVRK
jgi:predicted O-methyltransferase YrrM